MQSLLLGSRFIILLWFAGTLLLLVPSSSTVLAQGEILVNPTADIIQLTENNPPGTTFLLASGTYRIEREIVPKVSITADFIVRQLIQLLFQDKIIYNPHKNPG